MIVTAMEIKDWVRSILREALDIALKRARGAIIAVFPEDLPWNRQLMTELAALEKALVEKDAVVLDLEQSMKALSLECNSAQQEVKVGSRCYRRAVDNLGEKLSNSENRILDLGSKLENSRSKSLEQSMKLNRYSFQLQRAKSEADRAAEKLRSKESLLGDRAELVESTKQELRTLRERLREKQESELKKNEMEIRMRKNIAEAKAEQRLSNAEKNHEKEMEEICKQRNAFIAVLKQTQAAEIEEAQRKVEEISRRHETNDSLMEAMRNEHKGALSRIAELEKQLQTARRQRAFDFRGLHVSGVCEIQGNPFKAEGVKAKPSPNSSLSPKSLKRRKSLNREEF